MNNHASSYWCERFLGLSDTGELKRRIAVAGPVLGDLSTSPLEEASRQLAHALEIVFHPTNQCICILQRLVDIASAHCIAIYGDEKSFLGGLYADKSPLPEFVPPLCLTGLAGTGKTEILKAFYRLLSKTSEIVVDPNHPPFRILPPWLVTVQTRSTVRDVLSVLAKQDGKPFELAIKSRKLAYRDGVPFLIADELQFVTGSDSANTRVAQMLMALAHIGVPFIFSANFSMLQRLMRRPGEEQQRLLANPIVLSPDPPASADWRETLEALRAVAPKHFMFKSTEDAVELHRLSAGRKRAMAKLLLLAFRMAHGNAEPVDLGSISKAYKSAEYTVYRNESEILFKQSLSQRPDPERKDLWSPIPATNSSLVAELKDFNAAIQERNISEAEIRSSLTPAERKVAASIEKSLKHGKTLSTGKILPIHKNKVLDAATLKLNAIRFQDDI